MGMGMDGEFRFVDGTAFMNLGEKTKNKFVDWAEAPAGTLDVDAMFSEMSPCRPGDCNRGGDSGRGCRG